MVNRDALGLVGLGHIGRRMVRYAEAFDMKTVAWSPSLTDERAKAAGTVRVELEELMRSADFVSVYMVLAESTRGLIGAAKLALMKPTAFLINTSRGPLVQEDALIAALKTKKIAGPAWMCSTLSRCQEIMRFARWITSSSHRTQAISPTNSTKCFSGRRWKM